MFFRDHEDIKLFVDEFTAAQFPDEQFQYARIYKSNDFPDDKQVYRVKSDTKDFALKINSRIGFSEVLRQEFKNLSDVEKRFIGHDSLKVVHPVYLSPSGKFMVVEYTQGKTLIEMIDDQADPKKILQVYRKAGGWINCLHGADEEKRAKFWPNWMVEKFDDLLKYETIVADRSVYLAYVHWLKSKLQNLEGRRDIRVLSHGDMHGNNLIVHRGNTYGIDFSETKYKLAIYDLVDLLKMDVRISAPLSELGDNGVIRKNYEMFFRKYKHPVDHELLNSCIKARLLMDWLNIRETAYKKSSYQRRKFVELEKRLSVAFAEA